MPEALGVYSFLWLGWGLGWWWWNWCYVQLSNCLVFTYHRHTLISHLGVLCRGIVVTEVCRHS